MLWSSDKSEDDRRDLYARSGRKASVVDDINAIDPFINLAGPDKEEYKEFMGSEHNKARLLMHDGSLIPQAIASNRPGIRLSFSIIGGKLAKRIALSVRIACSDIRKVHQVYIEFYPGYGQVKDLMCEDFLPAQHDSELNDNFLVTWKTNGGLGAGLVLPTSAYDRETQSAIEYLRSILERTSKKERVVSVVVKNNTTLKKHLDSVSYDMSQTNPWRPYLDDTQEPRCKYWRMATRKSLNDYCGRLIRLPQRNSFANVREAHVALAYGTTLEFRKAPQQALRSSWPRTVRQVEYLQRQLSALDVLFSSKSPKGVQSWVPVFLNQAVETLPEIDPVDSMDISENDAVNNMKKVLDTFPWTNEQRSALQTSRALRGKVGIIEGVPGSGKTHIIAGMALFYALCGGCVLLFAPSNSQAASLAKTSEMLLKLAENKDLAVMKLYSNEASYDALRSEVTASREHPVSFIVTTPNAVCEKNLVSLFGRSAGAEHLFVLHDDGDCSLEPEVLASVFALAAPTQVRALIVAGDTKEWALDVVTQVDMVQCMKDDEFFKGVEIPYSLIFTRFFHQRGATPASKRHTPLEIPPKPLKNGHSERVAKEQLEFYGGVNEFADQIGLDLLSRLRRQGFPVAALYQQYRMRPNFVEFLNDSTYRNIIKTFPAVAR